MNTLIGKSSGIALLMAAALLAALFAMGVFAPTGVGASVDESAGKTPTQAFARGDATDDDTITVTFFVDDTVDGMFGGVSADDSVVINVPLAMTSDTDGTATAKQSGADVGNVMVEAGPDPVAMVITISKPAEDSSNGPLVAGRKVTVTVSGIDLTGTAPALPAGVITIQQNPSTKVVGIVDQGKIFDNAEADLVGNDLVVKFTARRDHRAGYDVLITPDSGDFSGTATAAEASSPADTTTNTGALATTVADNVITVTGYDDGATITITISDLTLTQQALAERVQKVKIAEGTHHEVELTVGADPVRGPGAAPTVPTREVADDVATFTKDTLDTNKAGASVRVTVAAENTAGNNLTGATSIKVTLEDFIIPSTIDRDHVVIDARGRTADSDTTDVENYYGRPESVSVSGDVITLRLPLVVVTATTVTTVDILPGNYKIIFLKEAGLMNPTSEGEKTVKVTVLDREEVSGAGKVNIVPSVSVEPKSGFVTRGGDATVTAKGLRDGTTTVYLLKDDGSRGSVLGSATASGGVAAIEIDTSGKALKAGAELSEDKDVGENTLIVVDADNDEVERTMLGIKPTVKLTSDTAERSGKLEISVSDWYYGDINMITVGGIEVAETDGTKTIDVGDDMAEKFEVTVPADVRVGEQEVKVTGENPDSLKAYSATAMVTISALALDVSPSMVVPGQQITITGSGFAESEDVKDTIMIGGIKAKRPSDATSTSSGRIAVTVTVPIDVGTEDKKVTLEVGDRVGEGKITVAKPSIELDPSESVPGSVISVNGSGFDSSGRFEVMYAGKVEAVGQADSGGQFSIRLTVPSNAGIGQPNDVVVQSRTDGGDAINAKDEHRTPGSMITLAEQAQVGTLTTISGTNFAVFSQLTVKIGSHTVTPTPAPETDKNGAFEVMARVPRIPAGSHTVTVTDAAGNSSTETFTVILTPVVNTPEEEFGVLGDALVVVWKYNNPTTANPNGSWESYDPNAPAELNDLTGVSSGDIVWIEVNAEVMFQGDTLSVGWNLISLE